MTETRTGIREAALAAYREQEEIHNRYRQEHRLRQKANLAEQIFGLVIEPTDGPIEIDGLRFDLSDADSSALVLLLPCCECGRPVRAGEFTSLPELGRILSRIVDTDDLFCDFCDPPITRAQTRAERLLAALSAWVCEEATRGD